MLGGLRVVGCSSLVSIGLAIAGCSGGSGSVATPAPVPAAVARDSDGSRIKSSVSPSLTATVITETPRAADSFVDSVGIDTHFNYPGTPYVTDYSTVMGLLSNLGVRHIRDSFDNGKAYYNTALTTASSHGIHVILTAQMNTPVSEITAFVASIPNTVEGIESPNEPDLNLGSNWVSEVQSYQPVLYAGIKSSPVTSSLPVYGPSITSAAADQAAGNLSKYMDAGNMHEYMGPWYPFDWNWMPGFLSSAGIVSGTKPVIMTETGYQDSNVPSAAVKARYTIRTSLEAFNGNVMRTYFYELADEENQTYGLLDGSGNPKTAYFSLKSLLTTLSDPGAAIHPQQVSYSMTADPSVHHMLLQKRDGSYWMVLWVSTQATDPVTPTESVTLQTSAKFKNLVQYTWGDNGNVTTAPIVQATNGSIVLTVTDRVSALELH